MAGVRRRSGFSYLDAGAGTTVLQVQPQSVHPPDGYRLIEPDLHRATVPLKVASLPFLSDLKLRSVINLSAEPLDDKIVHFLRSSGVALMDPPSLDAFGGPYDLWEEGAKEALELVLDAGNQPMLLLDSLTDCEAGCLIGCLRRLQHWSICAIQDEYQMMTMRSTSYDTNQSFIERFDLDLVTLTDNTPRWYKEHLAMLEDERLAEDDICRRDPARVERDWVHGFCPSQRETPAAAASAAEMQNKTVDKEASVSPREMQPGTGQEKSPRSATDSATGMNGVSVGDGTSRSHTLLGLEDSGGSGVDAADSRSERVTGGAPELVQPTTSLLPTEDRRVPDYRLNGFVYACPLISAGSRFTAKEWLQDEDD